MNTLFYERLRGIVDSMRKLAERHTHGNEVDDFLAEIPIDDYADQIEEIIDPHGNCEKCSEEGDPSCPHYGEPDGCNDRKWQAEHYPTTETYDYVKEAKKCTK